MSYYINVFTDAVIEEAFQKAMQNTSNQFREYIRNGIIKYEVNEHGVYSPPFCNDIMYPEIIQNKVTHNYSTEEKQLLERAFSENTGPIKTINIYATSSLLNTTVYWVKVYVDSSLFGEYENVVQASFEGFLNQVTFLINHCDHKHIPELVTLINEFIDNIPTINNYRIIDSTTGKQESWASLIKLEILEKLEAIIREFES